MARLRSYPLMSLAVMAAALAATAPAQAAPDAGKKACLQDAKKLCPAEMKTLSRKRVQACLIAKMSQVSPVCHATMMTLKSQHDAARHQPALPAKR